MMKQYNLKIGMIICLAFNSFMAMTQTQKGNDIDGEGRSGWSVSMASANVVAIGGPDSDGAGNGSGYVRVYEWNGTAWIQKGADVNGSGSYKKLGTVVSMPDKNTFAAGAPGSGNAYGKIKVYEWDGSAWMQKGTDINGLSYEERFGYSLSMPDANTFAVGAQGGSSMPNNPNGKVYVYEWNGSIWAQKGNAIIGEASGDNFGYCISMPSANTVAVSTPMNDGSFSNAGHVRIYTWNGSDWIQKGSDIDGEAAEDNSGWSISMPDESTIAVGGPKNAGGGFLNGHTRIYEWNGTAWAQKGSEINGTSIGDNSGFSVSMSDNNTVAISSPYNGDVNTNSGKVKIYSWDGTAWSQTGNDILGEAEDDESGRSISMVGSAVAIGAIENNGNGSNSGHVRVYEIDGTVGITETAKQSNAPNIYPNPTKSVLNIETEEEFNVEIVNTLGEIVAAKHLSIGSNAIAVENLHQGVYFIRFENGNTLKFVKK